MSDTTLLSVSSEELDTGAAGANLTGSSTATCGGSGVKNCILIELVLRHVFGPAVYLSLGPQTMQKIGKCLLIMKMHDIAQCSVTGWERRVYTVDGVAQWQDGAVGYIAVVDEIMDANSSRVSYSSMYDALDEAVREDECLSDLGADELYDRKKLVAVLQSLSVTPKQAVYVPADAVACDLRDSFSELWSAMALDEAIVAGLKEAVLVLRHGERCGRVPAKVEARLSSRNKALKTESELGGACFIACRLSGSQATGHFARYARSRVGRGVATLLLTLALSKAECVYKALGIDVELLAEFGRAAGLEYGGPYILDGLHRDVVDLLFRTVCGKAVYAMPTVPLGHVVTLPEGAAYNTETVYVARAYDRFVDDMRDNMDITVSGIKRKVSGQSYWLAPWVLQNSTMVFDRETHCRAVLDYRHQNCRLGGNSTWAAIGGEVYIITRIGRTGEVLAEVLGDTRDYGHGVAAALEGVPTGYNWTYRCCRSYSDTIKCVTVEPRRVAVLIYNALNTGHLTCRTGGGLHVTCCAPRHVEGSPGGFCARGVAGELMARGVGMLPPGYTWASGMHIALIQPFSNVATDYISVVRRGRLAHFSGRVTTEGTALVGVGSFGDGQQPRCVCAGLYGGVGKQQCNAWATGERGTTSFRLSGIDNGGSGGTENSRAGWVDRCRLRSVGEDPCSCGNGHVRQEAWPRNVGKDTYCSADHCSGRKPP